MKLFNYYFKDKWDKSVEETYDKYDINGYRKDHRVKNIKFTRKSVTQMLVITPHLVGMS